MPIHASKICFLGENLGKLTPCRKTPRKLIATKTGLLVHWASSQCSQGHICGLIQETKKMEKSTRGDNFTHIPTPPPHFWAAIIFWYASSRARRNQWCQILPQLVQGFRSPRWSKIAIFDWLLRYGPYNSVRTNVLHCDISLHSRLDLQLSVSHDLL